MKHTIRDFLLHILHLIVGLFVEIRTDGKKLIEDKRTWGTLFLITALAAPFLCSIPVEAFASVVLVGVSLYLGIPLSTSTPFATNLESMGLLDLFTNYKNQSDPARLFGAIFLISALVIVFSPLWGATFQLGNFWVLSGGGLFLLFGAAVFGDRSAPAQ